MASIGEQFKAAREAKGVTPSQAAAATRMKVQHIEAMERSDFSHMAAPAYAKGFIRLYAEYLDMPADPLIALYLEQYTDEARSSLSGNTKKNSRKRPPFHARNSDKSRRSLSRPSDSGQTPPRRRKSSVPPSERLASLARSIKGLWRRAGRLSREHVIPVLSGAAAIVILFLMVFGISHCSRGWEQRKAREAARKDVELPASLIEEPPAPYVDTDRLALPANPRGSTDSP